MAAKLAAAGLGALLLIPILFGKAVEGTLTALLANPTTLPTHCATSTEHTPPDCTSHANAAVGANSCNAIHAPNPTAMAAITYACQQRGLPYVWGGDGPAAGHTGFDCSGLTTAAYAAAGITLPRTAHTQYHTGPHVSPALALLPGDLVFYGTTTHIHHVGLYIGTGHMIHAPTFGQPIQISPHRWPTDDYLGATRPNIRHSAPLTR